MPNLVYKSSSHTSELRQWSMIMTDLIWTDNVDRQTIALVINGSSPYLLFLFWSSRAPLNHVIHPDGGLYRDLCCLVATQKFGLLEFLNRLVNGRDLLENVHASKVLPLTLIITVLIIFAHIFRGGITGRRACSCPWLWMRLTIEAGVGPEAPAKSKRLMHD